SKKWLRPGPGCNDDAICIQAAAILQPDGKSITARLNVSCTTRDEFSAARGEVLHDSLHEALRVGDIAVLRLKYGVLEFARECGDQIVDGLLIQDLEIHPTVLPQLPAAHGRLKSAA